MIVVGDGSFGLHLLLRVHGSAAYKAVLPAGVSCLFYYLLRRHFLGAGFFDDNDDNRDDLLEHPYSIAALVASVTVLLSSKVTFAYNRFWEACTALHNMQAKWIDVGTTMASYHLQAEAFASVRPPSSFDARRTKRRPCPSGPTANVGGTGRTTTIFPVPPGRISPSAAARGIRRPGGRKKTQKRAYPWGRFFAKRNSSSPAAEDGFERQLVSIHDAAAAEPRNRDGGSIRRHPRPPQQAVVDECMDTNGTSDCAAAASPETRSLFLQEAMHLLSLLNAVALSTIRTDFGVETDVDGGGGMRAEALLATFIPGARHPTFDSDDDPDATEEFGGGARGDDRPPRARRRWRDVARLLLCDASDTRGKRRANYDAARPFLVVGGVSDAEAKALRAARGPLAKVALASFWINEFYTREHLSGGMGNVGPPIVSRLHQYTSDGMLWYNAARKCSYVPFPFVHAQLAIMCVTVAVFVIPVLMLTFAQFWPGFVLNFFTVLAIAGINEVSRELENPFRNAPNDLPLNLFQAHFNEAIMMMCTGYHPDAWWGVDTGPPFDDDGEK